MSLSGTTLGVSVGFALVASGCGAGDRGVLGDDPGGSAALDGGFAEVASDAGTKIAEDGRGPVLFPVSGPHVDKPDSVWGACAPMKWSRGKTPDADLPPVLGAPVIALPSKKLLMGNASALYDSTSDSYFWLPDLTAKFSRHVPWSDRSLAAPLLLGEGRTVMLAGGGSAAGFDATADVFLLDTLTGRSKMATRMLEARGPSAKTFLLPSGKALIIGGSGATHPVANLRAEIYDPASDSWAPSGTPVGFLGPDDADALPYTASMVQLDDGDVFVTGSIRDCGKAYRYHWRTDAWSLAASLPATVAPYRAVVLSDGSVFVAGGERCGAGDPGIESSDRSFVYDPTSDRWSERAVMNQRRTQNGLVRLPCGRILAISGHDNTHPVGILTELGLEIYDPTGDAWHVIQPAAGEMDVESFLQPQDAMVMPDGGVVAFGVIKVTPGKAPAYCDNCERPVFLR